MKIFLDVDGVLLGIDRERPQRLLLADHALDFLAFVLARAEAYWLTPHCRGDSRAVVDHIVRHSKASDRERVMKLAPQVRATDYRGLRTEALPADGRFVWLDDAPEQGELAMLRGRGWLDRWLFVDTREEPEDLLRAQQALTKRLGGKAQSHGG